MNTTKLSTRYLGKDGLKVSALGLGCMNLTWAYGNVVSKEAADEDTLRMIALDAGAEDVSTDGDGFEITTAPEDFLTVSEALEKEGIAVEASEVTMVPDNTVSLEGDAADVMNKLTSELEELDDVQDVYTNAELPEDME